MNSINTFTAKGFSETSPFMHLNNHIFWSQQLQKYLIYEAHFFSEHWKFNVDCKITKLQIKKKKKAAKSLWFFG